MEEEKKNTPEEETGLDIGLILHDMVRGFLKYWYVVLALVLVLGLLGLYRCVTGYVPMYTSRASFTVVAPESENDNYSYSAYYDRATASQLAATFPYLLQTDILRELIKQDLGTDFINGNISASSLANSNLFTLTVTSPSAQDARDILESVIRNYPVVSEIALGQVELKMIDPPQTPTQPYNQLSWIRAIGKYALVGLVLGIAFLALYALTRNTIRHEKEIEDKLNQPCLAALPWVMFKKRSGRVDQTVAIFNDRTGAAFQEGFRGLALRTVSELAESGHKVLGITGTVEGEGTTTVARNLAMALAEGGHKVLLLDAHFQADRDKSDRPGLESYLDGSCQLADILVQDQKARIWTIGCRKKMTSVELARYTQQLQALILGARSVVDYILVDIPACDKLSEASVGIELCEGLMYVIRQDNMKLGRIMDGMEDLSRYDAKLYGCILNGTQGGLTGYGYGYGYGYNYARYSYSHYGQYGRYGYGQKKKK